MWRRGAAWAQSCPPPSPTPGRGRGGGTGGRHAAVHLHHHHHHPAHHPLQHHVIFVKIEIRKNIYQHNWMNKIQIFNHFFVFSTEKNRSSWYFSINLIFCLLLLKWIPVLQDDSTTLLCREFGTSSVSDSYLSRSPDPEDPWIRIRLRIRNTVH